MPEEAERQEREEDGLQPTQVPSSQQVRFNVFFSLRPRTRDCLQKWRGEPQNGSCYPPLPSMGKGIGMERCLTAWTLRRLPRRASHSDPE